MIRGETPPINAVRSASHGHVDRWPDDGSGSRRRLRDLSGGARNWIPSASTRWMKREEPPGPPWRALSVSSATAVRMTHAVVLPMSPEFQSPSLLSLYLQGDPSSERTLRSWVQEVVSFGRWRFSDPEAVVQEVMIRLLVAGRDGRYRGESSLKTFVRSMAKHACIDAHRRAIMISRTESPAVEADSLPAPGGDPESARRRAERVERLRYVVETLSDDCRRLWRWVYQEGLSSRQVAERLGIGEGAVRARVHRCLNQARRIARESTEGTA